MMYNTLMQREKYRDGFFLPNDIFRLSIPPGALAVYSYLKSCEDRRTHTCWPSYRTIGAAVDMSENTVCKYISLLADRRLIRTEPTKVRTQDGRTRNGNLRYTILPIRNVLESHQRDQLEALEISAQRQQAAQRMAEYERRHPREPLCETGTARPDPCPTRDREAPAEALRGTKKEAG